MSAIQQMIVATSGGYTPPPSMSLNNISPIPGLEGNPIYIYYNYANFTGQPVYWQIYYYPSNFNGASNSNNFTGNTSGVLYPYGTGGGTLVIGPKADGVTEGDWYYGVMFGPTPGSSDYILSGWYQVGDISRTPNTSLVFDYDPANLSGHTLSDSTSNHFDGFFTWAVTHAGIENGYAVLIYDGSSSYIEVPALRTAGYPSVSVSAWIKPSSVSGGETILAKEVVYKLRINSGGQLSWAVSNNGYSWSETLLSSTGAVSAGQWYHVAATIDGSHQSLYVNGTLVQQTTGLTLSQNGYPFLIGAYANNNPAADFFAGSMGEVKFWNYAITDSDVTNEFNNTRTRYILPQATSFDLVAPPSDGRGNPWTDSSSGITATVLNQVGNWGTTSNYGGGIVWDSNNNGYVTLNCYDTTTSFTLSLAVDIEAEVGHWNSIFGDYNSVSPFAYANGDTLTAGVGSSTPVYVSSGATGLAWWDFVYDGTTLKVYKNGSQVGYTGVVSFATSIGTNLQIGQRNGQPGDYLVGTLYRIKYQNTALDSTAITTQYNTVKSTYGLS